MPATTLITISAKFAGCRERCCLTLAKTPSPFHINEKGQDVVIDFPNYTTGICPELIDRVTKLVGPEHFRIDPVEIK